jgi:DNA polymerase-4
MNAFFAAVEQRANPALRGRPVAVVGANSRTVIVTASYEARAFGVKTGMTIPEGRRLCPHLVLVHARNDRYADACARLAQIYRDYTPLVEVASVDEAYLDVTATLRWWMSRGLRPWGPQSAVLSHQSSGSKPPSSPARGAGTEDGDLGTRDRGPTTEDRGLGTEDLARAIKDRVRAELGLPCSIGIAPNKLLAKLASDLKKPDGLVRIRPEEAPALLETLPVEELCGIGRRMKEHLAAMGIRACGELGRYPEAALVRRFGVIGRRLSLMGRGIDDGPVVPVEETPDAQSVGHSLTLPRDITERADFERELLRLADRVAERMRAGGYAGRTVALTLRYRDFTTFSRRRTLAHPTACAFEIYEAALGVLGTIRLLQPVRLVGISVGHLERGAGTGWLFGELNRREEAERAMDRVNARFGGETVTRARLLGGWRHRGVIAPAWRPDGVRRIDYT